MYSTPIPRSPSYNHWSVAPADKRAGFLAVLDLGVHPLLSGPGYVPQYDSTEPPTHPEGGEDDPRKNPCPECDPGEVINDGPREYDTGHQPLRCSNRCGWSA